MGRLIDRWFGGKPETKVDEKRRQELTAAFGIMAASGGAALAFKMGILNQGELLSLFRKDPAAANQKLEGGIQAALGITSQYVPFPQLTSDPAGAPPGASWYRQDYGQINYQDGTANVARTVNAWKDFTGAPFVTVSPVGTAQGYPQNNGAPFGPDSLLNNVGPGLTKTTGIQEAYNTLLTRRSVLTGVFSNPVILLVQDPGSFGFELQAELDLTQTSAINPAGMGVEISALGRECLIYGAGSMTTPLIKMGIGNSFTFTNITFEGGGTSSLYAIENASGTAIFDYHFNNCFWGDFANSTIQVFNILMTVGSRVFFKDCQLEDYTANQSYGQFTGGGNPSVVNFTDTNFSIPNQGGFTLDGVTMNFVNCIQESAVSATTVSSLVNTPASANILPGLSFINHIIIDKTNLVNFVAGFTGQIGYLEVLGWNANALYSLFTGTPRLWKFNTDISNGNAGIADPRPTPTITNPPISSTVYLNSNPVDIEIYVPVTYSPTAIAAATMVPAVGPTSSPVAQPTQTVPIGVALDGFVLTYRLRVPSGYYYSFTVVNATLGTASVQTAA